MNKRFQGIVIGILLYLFLAGGAVFATEMYKQTEVTYRDIKLEIDGELITPRDANGNVVEPFISDGTTYLPVRAVSEALGKDVDWENETSTVIIKEKEPDKVYLYDIEPNYVSKKGDFYKEETDSVKYVGFAPSAELQRYNVSGSGYIIHYIYENRMNFSVPKGATYFSGEVVFLDESDEESTANLKINICTGNGAQLLLDVNGEFELNVSDIGNVVFECEGSSDENNMPSCALKDAVFYVEN